MLSSPTNAQNAGNLQVNISNLRNYKGQILVSVYKSADGFPSDAKKVYQSKTITIQKSAIQTVTFEQLPYGKYAISLLHDENSNFKMDFNWLGIPIEGFGVSNNAIRKLGAPRFEEAAFHFTPNGFRSIEISMYYF
jgi:uncharacterized protein (DUF2141 family)